MTDVSQLIITFVNPIILVMALVMVLSMLARSQFASWNPDVLSGIIFATAVVYSMSDPIPIPTGGIIDMRGMLIGGAVATLGPRVGMIALVSGLCMRGAIGGPGMYAGFASMLLAFGAGWTWHALIAPGRMAFWVKTSLLGLLISSQSLAIFLFPMADWATLFTTVAPYTTACNLVGTFAFKYVLDDEFNHLSHKQHLEQAAATDHLTGLHNRRSLEERFPSMMKDTINDGGMTALYFDIDHFKLINDTYGHAVGDTVLKVLTDRLSTAFRARDIFCRLGGDEFVVLLPNLSKDEALRIAERCRLLVSDQPVMTGGQEINATISIGAIWTRKDVTFDGLLHMADQALYEAKAMGRNAVAFKSRSAIKPPESFSAAA